MPAPCANRRVRRVGLTQDGGALEQQLTGPQRAIFAAAVNRLGPEAIERWGGVMDVLAVELGAKSKFNSGDT